MDNHTHCLLTIEEAAKQLRISPEDFILLWEGTDDSVSDDSD